MCRCHLLLGDVKGFLVRLLGVVNSLCKRATIYASANDLVG